MEYVTTQFREPLKANGVALAGIHDELEEIVYYTRKYLSIDKEDYQKIWHKLHTAPDADKCPNIPLLCELLFSIPLFNNHIERMFSSLKV